MQIRMLRLLKEKYFVLNKFQLILLCLTLPKMKKVVTKYVVCYSNNKCFKGWILEIIIKSWPMYQTLVINVHAA